MADIYTLIHTIKYGNAQQGKVFSPTPSEGSLFSPIRMHASITNVPNKAVTGTF